MLLRLSPEQAKLRKMVRDYFPRSIEQTLRNELKRLGVGPEVIEKTVRKLKGGSYLARILKAKELSNSRIELTTRHRIYRQLSEGLKKGETIVELSERVEEITRNRARALTITRTEAGQAVSTARFVAASAAGAKGKGWIHGRNPRPSHQRAARDYNPRTSPIAMGERFKVGGDRLMYPRDPAGSAGEIINCNCVMVTVRLKKTKGSGVGVQFVNAIGVAGQPPSRQAAKAA